MAFREKARYVEAFRYGIDEEPEWFRDAVASRQVEFRADYRGNTCKGSFQHYEAYTGMKTCKAGDWFIRDEKGNFRSMRDKAFRERYEPDDQMRI